MNVDMKGQIVMIIAKIQNGSITFARVTHRYDPNHTYRHQFTWHDDIRNSTPLPDLRRTVNSFESLIRNERDSSILFKLLYNNGEEYDSASPIPD
jgi:hypothetical protein